MARSCVPFPRHVVKISVGYYSNVQKLAGERTNQKNNGDAHFVWAFPVFWFRFPASTLNVGRGFVHLLCPEVLAGSLCLLAQRINNNFDIINALWQTKVYLRLRRPRMTSSILNIMTLRRKSRPIWIITQTCSVARRSCCRVMTPSGVTLPSILPKTLRISASSD